MIDDILAFQLDLMRVSAQTRREVLPVLDDLEKELFQLILAGGDTIKPRRLLAQSNQAIDDYYAQAQGVLDLGDLPAITADATKSALASVIPVGINVALPTAGYLAKLSDEVLVNGAVTSAWWKKQANDVKFRFAGQVRQGLAAAENNQQIIERIKPVLAASRREAAALVQTSVAAVANAARQAAFEENNELISRYMWLSSLDGHVCIFCAARADKTWTADGKKPIGHALPWRVPPIHFNDRCVIVPITKTWRELGADIDEPAPGQRASSDGPLPDSTTFDDFLKRKGAAFQDEVLGPGRADMWRRGDITLQDLIGGDGRPLTLAQLRAKYA